jgi:hypothetical protein
MYHRHGEEIIRMTKIIAGCIYKLNAAMQEMEELADESMPKIHPTISIDTVQEVSGTLQRLAEEIKYIGAYKNRITSSPDSEELLFKGHSVRDMNRGYEFLVGFKKNIVDNIEMLLDYFMGKYGIELKVTAFLVGHAGKVRRKSERHHQSGRGFDIMPINVDMPVIIKILNLTLGGGNCPSFMRYMHFRIFKQYVHVHVGKKFGIELSEYFPSATSCLDH